MDHPTQVEGFDGTLEELAQRVLRMRYDKVTEFFEYCEKEMEKQSSDDHAGGREILATMLHFAVYDITSIKDKFIRIWNLCAKKMEKN